MSADAKWRLLRKREVTLPTWRGWTIIFLIATAVGIMFIRGVHGFLAMQRPAPDGVLVVEGWQADYALQLAAREVELGHYRRLYVTGGPLESGAPLSEYGTYAELGASVLSKSGVNTNQIEAVPAPWVPQDRTFTCAVTLRDWFRARHEVPARITVLTSGAHARRSRLLFELAFGKEVQVGVISVPPRDYEPRRWWASSQGVRTVIGEFVAYGYARFVFSP